MSTNSDLEKGGIHAITPQQALGQNNGTLPASYGQAVRPSRIANPGGLGLFSFASTTLMLSLYNINTRGINHPNVVVGMALFTGGLAQFLAGMWEFPRGNAFGGTAFTSYGAFWMSYATILIPSSGVLSAYAAESELDSAIGIFLVTWTLVTFFFLIVALKKNVGFIALLACLTLTFALLSAGKLAPSVNSTKAAGVTGTITAFIAYYIGLSELLAAEDMAVVRLPIGIFPKRVD